MAKSIITSLIYELETSGRSIEECSRRQKKRERRERKKETRKDNSSLNFFAHERETHKEYVARKEKHRAMQKRVGDAIRRAKMESKENLKNSIDRKERDERFSFWNMIRKLEADGRKYEEQYFVDRKKKQRQTNKCVEIRVKELDEELACQCDPSARAARAARSARATKACLFY